MPRASSRLQSKLTQRAEEDHARRMAEIKAMAPLLAHLEPLIPALAERGLEVFPGSVALYDRRLGERRRKVLRLNTYGALGSRADKWLQGLLDLGFVVVEHTPAPYGQIVLRLGHLLVQIDAPEDPVEAAMRAQAYARRVGASAVAAVHAAPGQMAEVAAANPGKLVISHSDQGGIGLSNGSANAQAAAA